MSLPRLLALALCLVPLTFPAVGSAQNPPPAAPRLDRAGDPLPAGAAIRLGTTRFRHRAGVVIVGYSSDGGTLLTFSDDNILYFWDARTGRLVHQLEMKARGRRYGLPTPASVLLSGDGTTLALGADEGNCTIVDVATRKTIQEFKVPIQRNYGGDESPGNVLSYDGKVLVVAQGDRYGGENKVTTWNTATGKVILQYQPKQKGHIYQAVSISRDGATLVTVEGPNEREKRAVFKGAPGVPAPAKEEAPPKVQFRFLNLVTGAEQRSVVCPVNAANEATLRADAKTILVRSRIEGVRLVDAITGKEIRQFAGKQGTVRAARLSADHKTLLIADEKNVVQYDVDAGKELRTFPTAKINPETELDRYTGGYRLSLALAPDGKTLALPDQSAVSFWDVPSGKEVVISPGHRHRLDSVTFGPVGKLLTTAADGKVMLWDAATSEVLREFEQKPKMDKGKGEFQRYYGRDRFELFKVRAGFSPDTKSVAGLWWGGKVHIWDAETGKLRHVLGGSRSYTGFNFSVNGKFVALVAQDGTVELWDPAAAKEVRSFGAPHVLGPIDPNLMEFEDMDMGGASSAAFSPDGRTIITSGMAFEQNGLRSRVRYWELASGQERAHFDTRITFNGGLAGIDFIASALDNANIACSFSPDGKIVIEAGFSNIRLRNVRSGAEIRSFGGKQVTARTALFSPDGKMLIAGKYDGAVRIWDLATGTVILDFPAHQAPITALAFSPDGRLLMTGSGDTSALVWDWQYILKQVSMANTEPALPNPEKLWADLAGSDAVKAFAAMKIFANVPGQTVPFIKARLKPIPAVSAATLAKLIEDLDHVQYGTRQKAQTALEKLGDLAAEAIKQRTAQPMSAEMASRLGELQKKLDAHTTTPDVLQALRAVEILELIDVGKARDVLETLAAGVPAHRITQEARSSLKRLGVRLPKS